MFFHKTQQEFELRQLGIDLRGEGSGFCPYRVFLWDSSGYILEQGTSEESPLEALANAANGLIERSNKKYHRFREAQTGKTFTANHYKIDGNGALNFFDNFENKIASVAPGKWSSVEEETDETNN